MYQCVPIGRCQKELKKLSLNFTFVPNIREVSKGAKKIKMLIIKSTNRNGTELGPAVQMKKGEGSHFCQD